MTCYCRLVNLLTTTILVAFMVGTTWLRRLELGKQPITKVAQLKVSSDKLQGQSSRAVDVRASFTRDLSYTQLPRDRKYANRTIAFVFAGRRSRLQSQILYLTSLIETNELDYVHYYHCEPAPDDATWLQSLPGQLLPSWFELRPCGHRGKGTHGFIKLYGIYEDSMYRNATFIKLDDDMVYMSTDGFSRAVAYVQQHPEASWTSALVVNNPLFDTMLYREGIIPQLPVFQAYAALPFRDGIVGFPTMQDYAARNSSHQALHRLFLKQPELYLDQHGVNILPAKYRVCLNSMVFTQAQLQRWNLKYKIFDELAIRTHNERHDRHVHLFRGWTTAHFSYGAQQRVPGMVNESLTFDYLQLACRHNVNVASRFSWCSNI